MSDRRSLTVFFLVTFALTWGIALLFFAVPDVVVTTFGELGITNPLFLLAVYSPAIAAVSVVLVGSGPNGVVKFAGRVLLWRCHPACYLGILLGIPVLVYLTSCLMGASLAPDFSGEMSLVSAVALALVVGPIEEFGWRGLALPLLQRRFAPLSAGLIVGAVWGVWHIPAFLLSGTPQSQWDFVPYFVGLLGVSVLMTGLFNASRGSLLLAMLIHFQLNNPIFPNAQPYDAIGFGIAALVLVVTTRKTLFSREHAATTVVPGEGE